INYGLTALGLLAAIAFLPRLVTRLRKSGWIEIRELTDRLAQGQVTIIDVREPGEFTGPLGHIAQAVNLPLGTLSERMTEIKSMSAETVILVCRTDRRSANAAGLLRKAGFHDVRVLRGGMEAWNRKGLPVQTGTP
ncbi:MAG: rhodanese-like domain-containing protein, partial [Alphaproteobacteria bacterium]